MAKRASTPATAGLDASDGDATRLRPRNLAHTLVAALGQRIQDGRLRPGDKLPPEAAVMAEFGVSRTVVREALSMLQASHQVITRHGIGTFVATGGGPQTGGFRVSSEQLATLHEVIALLELRIAIESETAGLAAQRRQPENLRAMRAALDAMDRAVAAGEPAIEPDFRFHLEIARATQNAHFAGLMQTLGVTAIPRARLDAAPATDSDGDSNTARYLRQVQGEHEGIFNAIAEGDAETARTMMRLHLANSRDRRRRAAALAEAQAAAEQAKR
jgi:GntR family transcriptional regulator, transcriptional repressor for pyruvate dehydrogenase complex